MYTIKSGDTLSALAQRFGTSVSALMKANSYVQNANLIFTGKKLAIPGRGDAFGENRPTAPTRPGTPSKPDQTQGPSNVDTSPVSGDAAKQYAHYKKLIEDSGGKFKSGPNQMNLLGLRTDTSRFANGGNGAYDDQMVMVWKDSAGKPHVQMMKYNTEPAADQARYSNDVNRDGRPDQGRIPSGFYEFNKSSWKNGFCLRATKDFGVERDMNNNGVFDKGDGGRTAGGASMLFHSGGSSGTYSAGCQTFSPSDWARFMATVKNSSGPIGYTLISR